MHAQQGIKYNLLCLLSAQKSPDLEIWRLGIWATRKHLQSNLAKNWLSLLLVCYKLMDTAHKRHNNAFLFAAALMNSFLCTMLVISRVRAHAGQNWELCLSIHGCLPWIPLYTAVIQLLVWNLRRLTLLQFLLVTTHAHQSFLHYQHCNNCNQVRELNTSLNLVLLVLIMCPPPTKV